MHRPRPKRKRLVRGTQLPRSHERTVRHHRRPPPSLPLSTPRMVRRRWRHNPRRCLPQRSRTVDPHRREGWGDVPIHRRLHSRPPHNNCRHERRRPPMGPHPPRRPRRRRRRELSQCRHCKESRQEHDDFRRNRIDGWGRPFGRPHPITCRERRDRRHLHEAHCRCLRTRYVRRHAFRHRHPDPPYFQDHRIADRPRRQARQNHVQRPVRESVARQRRVRDQGEIRLLLRRRCVRPRQRQCVGQRRWRLVWSDEGVAIRRPRNKHHRCTRCEPRL